MRRYCLTEAKDIGDLISLVGVIGAGAGVLGPVASITGTPEISGNRLAGSEGNWYNSETTPSCQRERPEWAQVGSLGEKKGFYKASIRYIALLQSSYNGN